jgi:hypothetical protein
MQTHVETPEPEEGLRRGEDLAATSGGGGPFNPIDPFGRGL